ncbi:MAG: methylenetetrahydrofolate reductase [NAD(P)H], partial [Armatimonadetes bacterium]|nr:methylenetetrahydrofolate reductase [NAD(P)H] [Armatimonadota bacterium]
TQLFFDAADYFRYLEQVRAVGIDLPVIPGIMPITNVSQIERFTTMCGARIPAPLRAILEPIRAEEAAVVAAGIDWATEQCQTLLDGGAPGIHFYTLNRSHSTRIIYERLRAA